MIPKMKFPSQWRFRRVTRGGQGVAGKGLLCPSSKNGKKCPNSWKNMP